MNKINNIENEENKSSNEVTESYFDDQSYKESMDKIREEENEQKKIDNIKAEKLAKSLLNDKKIPINDFIETERKKGLNDVQISYKLLGEGYGKEIKDSDLSDDIKNSLNSFLDNAYSKYGYKVKDKDSFEKVFFGIIEKIINDSDTDLSIENLLKGINQELQKIEATSPISIDFIRSMLKEKSISFKIPYKEKLHGDWSDSKDVLNLISFYDDSFGDDCTFSEGYNAHEVFEKGKSIGLGIDTVQKKYSGEGIEVAIIDNPLAKHNDIIVGEHIKSGKNPNFHGSAVASILIGKKTGVAPSANLHYVETSSEIEDRDIYENLSKLKDKGIKVISMSFNLYDEWMFEPEEIKKGTKDKISGLVKELNEGGTWSLSGDEFIKNFGILGKKNPMGNPDDFQNYQVTWPDKRSLDIREKYLTTSGDSDNPKERFMHDFYAQTKPIEDLIFINSGDRTVADPNGPDSYRHDAIGGTSWTIPAVAGYYTLACQADPENMNPERFMQLARETAQLVDVSDIPEDMNNMTKGRISMNTKIKVLDIKSLIQKIEEEKNK